MRRQLTALLAAVLGVSLAGLASEYTASAVPEADTTAGVEQSSADDQSGQPVAASHRVTAREQQSAAEFWTPARMRDAISSDLIRVSQRELDRAIASAARELEMKTVSGGPGASAVRAGTTGAGTDDTARRATTGERWRHPRTLVARTSGKLFYRLRGENRVCSAGVIKRHRKNIIATAGHCVFSDTKPRRWSKNMLFVPGYKNGVTRAYGKYPATRLFTTGKWHKNRKAFGHDVGFVRLGKRVGGSRHVAAVVGWQGYTFGSNRTPWTHEFGYPSKKPAYAGKYLIHCAGNSRWSRPYNQKMYRVRCRMNQGSSGGPWIRNWKPKVGGGQQFSNVSLVSFAHQTPKYNWGPYWGRSAWRAFKAADRR